MYIFFLRRNQVFHLFIKFVCKFSVPQHKNTDLRGKNLNRNMCIPWFYIEVLFRYDKTNPVNAFWCPVTSAY